MTSTYKWEQSIDNFSSIPDEAVLAGRDIDGDDIFVVRVQHENNQLAASVTPNKKLLSDQRPVKSFEFLTGSDFYWSDTVTNGQLPRNAVPVGTSADGSYAFIGRLTHKDYGILLGSIHHQLGQIFFNQNSQEDTAAAYQVLCHPSEDKRQSLTRIPQCEAKTDHYQWVSINVRDPIPSNAVRGGYETGDRKLYVARMWIAGVVIPAKILGSSNETGTSSLLEFVSGPYQDKENQVNACQILTGTGFRWQACENGEVPLGAVHTGESETGETLFVGRGHLRGSLTPGKVVQSAQGFFIGHSWDVLKLSNYEVLVHDHGLSCEWKTYGDQMPNNVVKAGFDVCVGRVVDGDSKLIASVNLERSSVFTKTGDTVLESTNFQLLTGTGFRWSKAYKNGEIPKNAVPCGHNMDGEMCFIGRTQFGHKIVVGEISTAKRCMFLVRNAKVVSVADYEVLQHPTEWGKQALSCIPLDTNPLQSYRWVVARLKDTIPEDSIMAGWDSDEDVGLYVGRFFSAGEVLPATVAVDINMKIYEVTAAQSGKEIRTKVFQVLTGSGLSWQPCQNGKLPPGAIETGKAVDGESLAIGRASFDNNLFPGKVRASQNSIYVAWNDQVKEKQEFEVLAVHTENVDSFQWITSSIFQPLPENSVFVGLDADGFEIYAGRMMHDEKILPANILPRRRMAIGFTDGTEVKVLYYQVLVGTGFAWVDCNNGEVPPNAVKLLNPDGQEATFMGRVQNNKCLKLGRISPTQRCLFVLHENGEHRHSQYQALVKLTTAEQDADGLHWIAVDGTQHNSKLANVVPSTASAGSSFVGRLFHGGELLPAEVSANFKMAAAVFENSVVTSTKFEVLTGTSFTWEPSRDGGIPAGAITSGKALYGEWLFIGRANDDSHMRIGKVQPSHACIYVPFNSATKTNQNYEVLVQPRRPLPVIPINLRAISVEGEINGKCCICWTNEATMAVVPCGNLCLCCLCCQDPSLDRCPVCRGPKMNCIRIFKT